ncbi:MAG: YceI family protein [Bacteriovoracaceae bacterium]|nr:YceI family protein [Bacteriovoracaceae bacterium]
MKCLLTVLSFALFTSAFAAQLKIDSTKSKVGFEIYKYKIGGPVNGEFKQYEGTLDYDKATQTISNVNVTVQAASIDTQDAKRDEHLRTADFFDTTTFKTLTFTSTEKAVIKDNKANIKGKLTIKDKTQDVTLNLEVKGSVDAPVFTASTTIDRNKFGISWNNTFKVADLSKNVLADEVKIALEISTKN